MSGVQILFIINTKQPAVKLGTAKIYFLKRKRILNTVLVVEGWLMFRQNFFKYLFIKLIYANLR